MEKEIYAFLDTAHPWSKTIHFYASITSTNTVLKQMASEGAPHGTVLVADEQTLGRGRRGRSFLSPAGSGIYMSVLLRPQCKPEALMHLTCAVAEAMCDAVEKSVGFRPGIKWTNDLVYKQKKLSGILTELGLDSDGNIDYAVIGIGINCCQAESDFPPEIREIAGSLASVSDAQVNRAKVAAAMITALWQMDAKLITEKAALLQRYRQDCITIGQRISVVRGEEIRHGIALDVDDEGALIVRFDSGETRAVNSGEVSIRGMYGYV